MLVNFGKIEFTGQEIGDGGEVFRFIPSGFAFGGLNDGVQAFEDAIEAEPEIGFAARADVIATFERDPACHRQIDPLLYFKGYQAIQTHRMAHRLWELGRKDFAYYLQSRSSIIASPTPM